MKYVAMSFALALSFSAVAAEKTTKTTMDSVNQKVATSMETSQLDDLIRGEMAAVKAYDQVLTKVKDKNELMKLKVIRENHVSAVSKLKTFANKEVREDTKSAGAWGTFAEAYTGGAKLMGDEMALKALKLGEEHGISEYKEALDDKMIKPELKQMIKSQFLPKQEEHLKTLNSFI